jgi:phospholipase C
MRRLITSLFLAMSLSCNLSYPSAARAGDEGRKSDPAANFATNTPIKHVAVIFDENNSFDHCFGTYPNALNLPGETSTFYPAP